jgi:hypothetical protein
MGIFVFIGLILVAIAIGLTFLPYIVAKKMGYSKVGKWLSVIVGTFFVLLVISIVFEDQLFSKNDAKKLLVE